MNVPKVSQTAIGFICETCLAGKKIMRIYDSTSLVRHFKKVHRIELTIRTGKELKANGEAADPLKKGGAKKHRTTRGRAKA